MKTLKFALLTLMLASVFAGCKYEENPIFVLRSKKARLSQEWVASEIEIDGIGNGNLIWELEIDDDGTFIDTFQEVFEQGDFTRIGTWEFTNSKEKVKLTYDDGAELELTIKKLTMDEFWVDFIADGNEGGLNKWEIKFYVSE